MKRAHVYEGVVDGIRRCIGTDHGDRINIHMKKVRSIARRRAVGETVFTSYFYDKLTKAWLDGAEISFHVLFDGLSDEEALSIEAKMIAATPPGQLWNMAPDRKGSELAPHKKNAEMLQLPDHYKKQVTGSFIGFMTKGR